MGCQDCPYISNEYNLKTEYFYDNYDIYDVSEEDIINGCWCDKVGGKISLFGRCSHLMINPPDNIPRSKRRRYTKRQRDLKYKNHLKHISENSKCYPPSVNPINKYGHMSHNDDIVYYKRFYRGKASSYYKNLSNRKIRRFNGDISRGWWCHKLYDFMYEMY